MSKKRLPRKTDRFDYRVYDKTGKKVSKEQKRLEEISDRIDQVMSREQLISDEAKLCLKIDRFVKDNEIDLFFDAAEIDDALATFTPMIDNFEHFHVELKQCLEEQEYKDAYKDSFDSLYLKMCEWTKKVKKLKLKMKKDKDEKDDRLRKAEVERQEKVRREDIEREEQVRKAREEHELRERQALDARLAAERAAREEQVRFEQQRKADKLASRRKKLVSEEKVARERNALQLQNIAGRHCVFVEDYDQNISEVKDLLKSYSDLFVKIEEVFEEDYDDVFGGIYRDQTNKMNSLIQRLAHNAQRVRLRDAAEKRTLHEEAQERDAAERERENELKMQTFRSIYGNIRERAYGLQSKYTIEVHTLPDEELLEKSKELVSLDKNFDDLLDWMTELVKTKPYQDPESDDILRKSVRAKEKLKILKTDYQQNVRDEISTRDLTSEKMKNTS